MLLGCLLGFAAALIWEGMSMLVGNNVHVVMPGRIYRTAQLSPRDLQAFVRTNNIRTVINLRGFCPSLDWYQNECRATHELGVCQEDVTLSANRLPSPLEIRRLVDVLDHTEYPVVFHCRRGADRTGLASTVALLLHSDADYATCRRQCSPRYGHFPILTTESMDEFFAIYEKKLQDEGVSHTPARFRNWILHEYCPGNGAAQLEVLSEKRQFSKTESPYLKVRAYNISNEPWHFKPGTFTGVYLDCTLVDADGNGIGTSQTPGGNSELTRGRYYFGQRECIVPPGEFIDLDVAFPPIPKPGRYYASVDLAERRIPFVQYGSELLVLELVVTE